ncbi:cytochrome P450 [Archangium lansingense]|uniref:Cytochrome P450 n=1 Tax=Archangium lansingense TaxID=2995310 RepID=A0ABT4A1S3_9BACT|nr:cytochrome P450 [Archangium lansinium]MCY1074932.1 cytochrome P450 [Archangium lansinium]
MKDLSATKRAAGVLPPKVSGYPLVGSLPGLAADPLSFVAEAQRKHGDIFTLDLGFTEALVVCHPKYAQHILVDNARNYSKSGPMWDSLRTFMGNALPVSEGDFWLRQRRMIQPMFHQQRLAELTTKMVEAIDASMADWVQVARKGQPFDIAHDLSRVTMSVLVRTMFGSGLELEEAERVAKSFTYILDYFVLGMATNPLPEWLPVPGRARYREEIRNIDEVLQRIINRGRANAEQEDNLLSLLLNMVDAETGERMTDKQLRDEAVAFFVAGYETTAAGLCWVFHVLTRYPEIAARMLAEVDEVLGNRSPTFADLSRLDYCRRVLHESFRVYSPSIWLPRMSVEEDEMFGYQVPPGRMMVIFTYLLHRHPDVWKDPMTFDPDRFTPENSEGRHKLAWLPFGAGQRQCIGKGFSLMEAQLIMLRAVQRFLVSAVPGREPTPKFSTNLRTKDGVWVYLKERAATSQQRESSDVAA